MAILFAKLPFSEVDFDETDVVLMSWLKRFQTTQFPIVAFPVGEGTSCLATRHLERSRKI
jgi:hypothetical protein